MNYLRKQVGVVLESPGVVVSVLLALTGCLAIYNATSYENHPTYFVYRQLAWLAVGTMLLIGAKQVKVSTWYALAWPAGIASSVVLILLLVWGEPVRGMRGWFTLRLTALEPIFSPLQVQPTELAKPLFVLCLAMMARDPVEDKDRTWKRFGQWVAVACMWFIPIFLQPDFGTLMVYGIVFLLMYYLQGGRLVHLASAVGAGLLAMIMAVWLHPYVKGRLVGFLRPEEHATGAGWHILQFQAALANGGWTGTRDALWSRYYLPLGYSDSIVGTVGERIGFLGLLPIMAIIGGWVAYGLMLARRQDDFRGALLVSGLTAMLAAQAMLHMSVTLGLLPPTGITFPLLSYGGSSLCGSMLAIGMVLSAANKGRPETCKPYD